MAIDKAILDILPGPSSQYRVPSSSSGSFGTFGSTHTISDQDGKVEYFVKISRTKELVAGEHATLERINKVVPGFSPQAVGFGKLAEQPGKYFVVTEYLNKLTSGSGKGWELKLAEQLAKLHNETSKDSVKTFGLPDSQVTCCGNTKMLNPPTETWLEFFSKYRLQAILEENTRANGPDSELDRLGKDVIDIVCPRLLGSVKSIPSLVHGDLWRGNTGAAIRGRGRSLEPVIFDGCAFYADSEYELGIMQMFGGFSSDFYRKYHESVPIKEPTDEYEDRVRLYKLYHELNHSALFYGGGYASQAKSAMRMLIKKYAS
ncbi:Fructosamine/Ketosamine-3-kinase [Dipodascopsis uninucleata]